MMLYCILPQSKLTKENVTKLLKEYHDEFERLCLDANLGDKIKRRGWEEFREFFFTWATSFTFVTLLPWTSVFKNDFAKFANVYRFCCDELNIPEFLLKECA